MAHFLLKNSASLCAVFLDKISQKMEQDVKGYLMIMGKLRDDENLGKYAPKALEAMTNAGAKFVAERNAQPPLKMELINAP